MCAVRLDAPFGVESESTVIANLIVSLLNNKIIKTVVKLNNINKSFYLIDHKHSKYQSIISDITI